MIPYDIWPNRQVTVAPNYRRGYCLGAATNGPEPPMSSFAGGIAVINEQFHPERLDVHTQHSPMDPRMRSIDGLGSIRAVYCLLLAILLAGCETPYVHQRPVYNEPTSVSGRVIFARGQLPAQAEAERLSNTHTSSGLLRRAWLELQLHRPLAALDTAATVLFRSDHVSARDESFARYLRAEAYRQQGHAERGDYDLERARVLALDPELQRRLLPHVLAPKVSSSPWGHLAVQPRSAWNPKRANRNNLGRMKRIRRVTIHHSAMYFRETHSRAAASQIARIQREHMGNRDYGDIGYHFLIDPSGRIWEGRQLRHQGAHSGGPNNIGNIGICVLGNFVRKSSGQGPSASQIRSMEQLVVQLMRHYRFGGEALYCHSDFKNTQCPGPRMQPIVKQFAARLRSQGTKLAAPEEE